MKWSAAQLSLNWSVLQFDTPRVLERTTQVKTLALTVALSLCSAPVFAACDALVVHLASKHTHADMIPNLNERNLGLGCRIDAYEFGVYHNSIDTISAYVVHDWMLAGNFGLFAGLTTGYDESITVGGLTPMMGAAYKGDVVTLRANPMATPDFTTWGVAVGLSVALRP